MSREATQTQQQTSTSHPLTRGGILQRKCESCGQHTVAGSTCSPCQRQLATSQRLPHTGNVPEIQSSTGIPLPKAISAQARKTFHHDLSSVQVHTDSNAVQAANRLSARAFTVDEHIYFGAGWYQPNTPTGLQLIGHELTHVVQQQRGLSATDLQGVGDRYEQEADAAGKAFARGESVTVSPASGSQKGIQRSADPGADATVRAVDDSPYGLPFLGEANTPGELLALLRELMAEEGGRMIGLVHESLAMGGGALTAPSTATPPVATTASPEVPVQASFLGKPIQRAVVAGCNVPGAPPNVIGIAAHYQIGQNCQSGTLGCLAEMPIPGDGRADLVRQQPPPFLPEIGEIKPASWLGGGLTAAAQLQLAGYIAAYTAAFGITPLPMWSYRYPGAPFLLNPSQTLSAWGPSAGIYYYRCTGGRRRRVRVPVRVPIPVPVPIQVRTPSPAPDPSRSPSPSPAPTGPTPGQVGTGVVAVGAGIGIGYLIYRGVRLIPSLFPPAWPTLPVNLAVP